MQHLADVLGHERTLVCFELISKKVTAFLVCKAVPNTVASIDDEVVIRRPLNHLDVRLRGNGLVLRLQLGLVLVLKIADGSTQSQVTVDA